MHSMEDERFPLSLDPLDLPLLTAVASGTTRLKNVLNHSGQTTLRAFLSAYTPRDVFRMRNLGQKAFADFVTCLARVPSVVAHRWIDAGEEYLPDGFVVPPLAKPLAQEPKAIEKE